LQYVSGRGALGVHVAASEAWRTASELVRSLDEPSGPHPAADAHRDEPVARLAATELVQHRPDQARAAHPVGVTDRDRAAVRIQSLRIDPQAVAAVDRLRRERLVELDEVDVLQGDPNLPEQLRHSEHWTDAHLVGLACRDGEPAEDAERLHAERPDA